MHSGKYTAAIRGCIQGEAEFQSSWPIADVKEMIASSASMKSLRDWRDSTAGRAHALHMVLSLATHIVPLSPPFFPPLCMARSNT